MGKLTPQEKLGLGLLSILYGLAFPFVWIYDQIFGKKDTSSQEQNENNGATPPKP